MIYKGGGVRTAALALCCTLLCAAGTSCVAAVTPPMSAGTDTGQRLVMSPVPIPDPAPGPDGPYYPVGELIVDTPDRTNYRDGDMLIHIPRLDLTLPVLAGVTDDELSRGIGLFDMAQLPVSININTNTSIAGNRDIHGMEFYRIDAVLPGDLVYLTWNDARYAYAVEEQFITDPMDWDPIRTKDYPCITLMATHPVNIATDRIFVVGRLVEVTPGADLPPNQPGTEAP